MLEAWPYFLLHASHSNACYMFSITPTKGTKTYLHLYNSFINVAAKKKSSNCFQIVTFCKAHFLSLQQCMEINLAKPNVTLNPLYGMFILISIADCWYLRVICIFSSIASENSLRNLSCLLPFSQLSIIYSTHIDIDVAIPQKIYIFTLSLKRGWYCGWGVGEKIPRIAMGGVVLLPMKKIFANSRSRKTEDCRTGSWSSIRNVIFKSIFNFVAAISTIRQWVYRVAVYRNASNCNDWTSDVAGSSNEGLWHSVVRLWFCSNLRLL